MKKIVVINGMGGVGKDTFVSLVAKQAKVFNFSSVAKVKEIAKIIGWNPEQKKSEKDRKFLSDLKKLTTEYNDLSFNDACSKVDFFMKSDYEIMFIHIREKEEIERFVAKFGAITLLIKRNGVKPITTNSSDANVEEYKYDYVIYNNTLEQLENEAVNFIKKIQ